MSVRQALGLFFAISALAFLAACGGSSSPAVNPPPTGGFSTSTLNGTYVFSTAGYNVDGFFMTIAGALQANGSGGITGGTVDVVTSDSALGVSVGQTVSSASYSVGADGRGQISFSVNTASGSTPFVFDFVLASNLHGLITEFDSIGSGSGTIDLQGTTSQPTGSYTFSISGTGPGSGAASFATVGAMTLSSGAVTSGVQDFNSGGTPSTSQALATTTTVTVGTGTAPGNAQFVTTLGTFAYDVYAIDTTHFKLIETDGQLITAGDVFTQGTALPVSATLAFSLSGGDSSGLPLGLAGFIPLDANDNVSSGVLEDFNDGGLLGQDTSFTGGLTPLAAGRSSLSLAGFQNGSVNDIAGSYSFAAYPFTSNGVTGLELLEIDALGITSGIAYVQTGTGFAASQGYGLNVAALNFSGISSGSGEFEEDDIAEFTTTSSTAFSGIEDISDEGAPVAKQSLAGTYASNGTGYYTATVTSNLDLLNFNLYAVNDSTFLVLETDGGQVGTGVAEIQNATAAPGGEPGISRPSPKPGAHASLRHR